MSSAGSRTVDTSAMLSYNISYHTMWPFATCDTMKLKLKASDWCDHIRLNSFTNILHYLFLLSLYHLTVKKPSPSACGYRFVVLYIYMVMLCPFETIIQYDFPKNNLSMCGDCCHASLWLVQLFRSNETIDVTVKECIY